MALGSGMKISMEKKKVKKKNQMRNHGTWMWMSDNNTRFTKVCARESRQAERGEGNKPGVGFSAGVMGRGQRGKPKEDEGIETKVQRERWRNDGQSQGGVCGRARR